jgi:hypothetical protein
MITKGFVMRLIEVSLISLLTFFITSLINIPVSDQLYYDQLYILANDVFLHLYKVTNGTLYYAESYEIVKEKISEISNKTKLCIYFKNEVYEVKTCNINIGYFLNSKQHYGKITLGIGK